MRQWKNGHTVREQLEGNDVDQTLQAVDSLGYSNDLGSVGNRVIVLVTDDDYMVSGLSICARKVAYWVDPFER